MKRTLLLLFFAIGLGYLGWGQTTIVVQDFDATNTLTYTASGGTTYTGSSAAGDRPASSAFYASTSTAYGITNGTATLTFGNRSGLSSYISKYYEFRLASWSIGSTGNGADAGDIATVAISTDAGVTWSNELRVLGNGNAYWHYSTGTGTASVIYDGNNTTTDFAPTAGGARTTDGYSTVKINLPDAGTQAQIRITLLNNATGERWTIDDVKLIGTLASTPTITLTPSTLTGFGYTIGSGPSAEQNFTASGTNLTANISIVPPADYEISTGTAGSFSATNPITLTQTGGSVATTTINVRLKAGLGVNTYNSENIVASSTGATDQNVACSGSVYQQIDWANLQWPGSGTISLYDNYNVYAQVYESGLTEAVGQGAGITAWIGYSTTNSDPSTWTNWIVASYGSDKGNNDEYQANLGASLTTAGTYYYASRFQLGTAPYVYGGFSLTKAGGFWNGTPNASGVLTVNAADPIDWANLQSPASGSISVGGDFNVYAQVYEPDITNAVGQGTGITTWIGYSTSNTNPSTWNNWLPASYNADIGNNDEYMANIGTALASGTYYYASRFIKNQAEYVYGGYNGGFWDGTNNVSGTLIVNASEPTNHPTGIIATANSASSITISWTDAIPAAAGYLVKGSSDSYVAIAAPVDGIPEANASLVKNIAGGIQTALFTDLTASTPYYFKIYAYNGASGGINYKTDGSVPEATATTPAIPTYTWIGLTGGSWDVGTNWNPTRTTPGVSDVLLFNDGATYTIISVPTQTISQLNITNNSKITLQSAAAATVLTIGGGIGTDISVGSGSELNITGGNTLTIAVGAGVTGSISGSMTVAGAAHKFTAADASGITFNSGAILTLGTSFSGNIFGSTGTTSSVIFANGSTMIQLAGSNPFGTSAGIVSFQTGSLFKTIGVSPSFSGRTYANFEMDYTVVPISVSGTSAVLIDNLTITQGTFNFNMTATPGHSIKGNISVASGATLTFSPASAGTVNLNGSAAQTISGGGTITSTTNSTLAIGNAVIANNNMNLAGNLSVAANKSFTINPNKQITVTGTLTNNAGTTGLVIKSDATGTGSLIHNTSGVAATIERYLTGSPTTSGMMYHFVSVPLTTGGTSNQFLGSYLYDFNVTDNNWHGLGSATNTPLDNTKGYMAYYLGNNITYSFTGNMNNGTFSPTVVNAGSGYNLVPNPYPSALDWNAVSGWSKTNIGGTIYFWPAGAEANTTNYAAWNGTLGTNSGTQYIPVGQAFFVQTTGAPTFSMNNSVRVHNTQAFWKNEILVPNLIRIKSVAQKNNAFDELIVNFLENATSNFDNDFDANKLQGGSDAPQFSSVSPDNSYLAINCLPFGSGKVTVPLHFSLNTTSEVSFNASEMESFDESVTIQLEDKLLNKIIDLRSNPIYTFNHSSDDGDSRFNLIFYGVTSTGELTAKDYNIWSTVDHLNIHIPALTGQKATVELYDLLGHLVLSQQVNLGTPTQIAVPQFNGMGIVRVIASSQVFSEKVFIR
jgi:hypothetical protein